MNRSRHHRKQPRRRGFVLIAVLVVVVLLSLASYQFADLMTAEYRTADSGTREAQAHTLAEGGIDYVLAAATNPSLLGQQVQAQSTTTPSGSEQQPWQAPNLINNTSLFQGIVVDSGATTHGPQGRFSIVAPIGPDEIGNNSVPFHYGVTDEGGKINLNAIMKLDPTGQTLTKMLTQLQTQLPNLTDDVIASIVDWIDTDDTPGTNGAEDDYYSSQTPAYHCKNGPLDSLEEMLLIKGMTPQLLFGNDRNRNGILDPGEDDGSGQLSLGLAPYVTVYSRELNMSSNGQPRIYLNAGDLNQLQTDLTAAVGQDLAKYIVAYRQYGPAPTGGSGSSGEDESSGAVARTGSTKTTGAPRAPSAPKVPTVQSGPVISVQTSPTSSNTSAGSGGSSGSGGSGGGGGGSGGGSRTHNISSLFALVNSSVSIPASTPGGRPTTMPSPLNDASQQAQLLPLLLDQCTVVNSPELPARINVNTAPSAVLSALPGIQANDVENILAMRPDPNSTDPPDPIYQTTAWLLTQAHMSPSTLQSLEKYITASSQVYRVQSVGYFDQGGPTARIEAVIDTNAGMPRILFWHDLTDLGPGFNVQAAGGQ